MRMAGYYLFHSFINQIRKLLKTWVLIFMVCCGLIGGVIGFTAGTLFDDSEDTVTEEASGNEEEDAEEVIDPEDSSGDTQNGGEGWIASLTEGADIKDLFELAAGAVILLMFVYCAMSADKNGSAVFLPADVTLLFPAPLKPQSVLLFRLVCKLGTIVLFTVILFAETAGISSDMDMGPSAGTWVVLAWLMTLIYGEMLQIFLYTTGASRPGFKKKIRRGIYAVLIVLGAAFLTFWKNGGKTPAAAGAAFFNGPSSRYIPVWGWIKAMAMSGIEEKPVQGLIALGLCLVGIVILGNLIWRVKADFYEDAMAKSEETAALLEDVREGRNTLGIRGKQKDRGDRIVRDRMKYGEGASVFFFKTLYNRYRFAHLHFFTKTSETFLIAGAVSALLASRMAPGTGMTIPAFVLGGLTFFRSLKNPLEDELKTNCFLMSPEPVWKKLLFTELGGVADIFLDLLPGVTAALVICRENPLTAAGWVLLIITLYFYSINVGSFISATTPASAGVSVKQIVQVMFVYFGLLPDVGVLALGYSEKIPFLTVPLAVLLAAAVNVVIGFVFLIMIPAFLYPDPLPARDPARELSEAELKRGRRTFSLCGQAGFLVTAAATVLQIALILVFRNQEDASGLLGWVVSFAPIYCVAFPLGFLFLRRIPAADEGADRTEQLLIPDLKRLLSWFLIALFLMYGGNLLGLGVNTVISLLLGSAPVNPVAVLAMEDSQVIKVLVMVILAPLFEELFFRKALISRMKPYGEKTAVLLSALMFGLFHGNFQQVFYAFFLGLLFGYIYVKTGKLCYSLALHMIINFLGSIVAPALVGMGENNSDMLPLGIYIGCMVIGAAAGLVLLIINSRRAAFRTAPLELPKGSVLDTAYLNPGMILFMIGMIGLFSMNLAG